jgi:hypothetical protein
MLHHKPRRVGEIIETGIGMINWKHKMHSSNFLVSGGAGAISTTTKSIKF